MREYIRTTAFHLKSILKRPIILITILVVPTFMFVLTTTLSNISADAASVSQSVIINNSDFINENFEHYEHLEELFIDESELEDSGKKLERGDLGVIYEIPADFPENSTIVGKSISGEIEDIVLESDLVSATAKALLHAGMQDLGITLDFETVAEAQVIRSDDAVPTEYLMASFMIVLIQLGSAGIIGNELNTLRQNSTLKRSIISKTSGRVVLSSFLTAYGLFYLFSAAVSALIPALIYDVPLDTYHIVFLYLAAMVVFQFGFIMLIFRLVKDTTAISIILSTVGFALVYAAILGVSVGGVWEYIGLISPAYWMMEGLDQAILFPNILIILAMGLVCFTAGTMKVEKLVNVRA